MVSILTSITMMSITTYFMIAVLFLMTEKWYKVKNLTVILSFLCWSIGGLAFLYTSSYASAHGLMGVSAIIESIFSILGLILISKAYFFQEPNKAQGYNIENTGL